MRWSLKTRLSFGLAVSLVLLIALQWAIASVTLERLTSKQLLTRLQRDAESLLAGVGFDARGALRIESSRVSAVYERPFSGYYYVVASGEQSVASRSLWDMQLAVPRLPVGTSASFRPTGPERQPLLVEARAYRKLGHELTIVVAEDLSELNAGVLRFQLIYGGVSLAVLTALLLVQRAIVVRSLRPIDAVRQDMARLERGEATVIEASGPVEIAPLIAELNRLLSSMHERLRRSRESLGNLAHALKTRLAVLEQVAEAPALEAHDELRYSMHESVEGMRRIVERELKRARLSGGALRGERLDLEGELDGILHTLQAIYSDKSLAIHRTVSPNAAFRGDREDVLELLGNLLDNACKWARHRVLVTVDAEDGVRVVIEDDGPGCSVDALAALTRRGFRGDESKPGSGLGLAIVGDIVESFGGSLAFAASPQLQGLRVEVRLPAFAKDRGATGSV